MNTRFGERGRNRTCNLLIKSLASGRHSRSNHIPSTYKKPYAHRDSLQMLETLAMFSYVQPQLLPHPEVITKIIRSRAYACASSSCFSVGSRSIDFPAFF